MLIATLTIVFMLGLLYGHSFASQQRSVFASYDNCNAATIKRRVFLHFICRVTILAGLVAILLRSQTIPSILSVGLFIAAIWLVIIYKKAHCV
jgi:hypothetical protein